MSVTQKSLKKINSDSIHEALEVANVVGDDTNDVYSFFRSFLDADSQTENFIDKCEAELKFLNEKFMEENPDDPEEITLVDGYSVPDINSYGVITFVERGKIIRKSTFFSKNYFMEYFHALEKEAKVEP